ncbi:cytochrome P450 [Streptomyces sp. NPDC056373]|uniref:cytochrome P450 n=1 Tax=Streptomyces sp. NPDC056373 TaxID=3345798 RepID=UPI0035DACFC3
MSEETITAAPDPDPTQVLDRPAPGPAGAVVDPAGAVVDPGGDSALLLDPSAHARSRRAVAAAFTVRGMERVRERCRRMLAELVDELLQDGPPAGLTEAVLSPFADAVICELMGVPPADRQGMRAWTRLILSSHGTEAGAKAGREMGAYFSELIGLRAGSTGEDAASLLGAAVSRAEVTLDEAAGLAVLLRIGGEAVTDQSVRLFRVLLACPDLAERLRAEPETRPRAVDELLRGLPRRDADVVPGPGTSDLGLGPNPQVSFGRGPHHWPGGLPGRTVSELLVDALLDGVPGLRLSVPADELLLRAGTRLRGPESLPVTW